MFLTELSRHLRPSPPHPPSTAALSSFESSLRRRFRSLLPSLSRPLSLRCLSLVISAALSTLLDAAPLLSDPSLPASFLSPLLPRTATLLDACNAASALIHRLRRRRLFLLHGLRLLSIRGSHSEAKASLSEWERDEIPRPYSSSIPDPPASVDAPVVYAVEAVIWLAAAALIGEVPNVVKIPTRFSWAAEFEEVCMALRGEMEKGKEMEEMEEVRLALESGEAVELEEATGRLTEGLEELGEAVDGLFRAVIATRNAALDRFRVGVHRCT